MPMYNKSGIAAEASKHGFQDFGARILGDSISERNCPFFIIL